ncbi:hypothetical protein B0H16DRAFT_1600910 [Mycena metata]|uniref:Uncharacterized protein n=1 Tax=Mycena metata TaxID=1033252 RepID=A0AAD7MKT7_9AGAR|nr:hypothetical protein B0H16DRAFT_1600910 [Mycena metata]
MQFFTSFVLSALLIATASAQRGLAARNCTDDAAALTPLDVWAETHLSAVVHATNPDEVAAAFDAFWSGKVWIAFNGVATSAADYHARRITQGFTVTLDIIYSSSAKGFSEILPILASHPTHISRRPTVRTPDNSRSYFRVTVYGT